jgi:hypothetical protein
MNFSFLQYHFQILMQDIAMQDGYWKLIIIVSYLTLLVHNESISSKCNHLRT